MEKYLWDEIGEHGLTINHEVSTGLYRHFKGGIYQVLTVAVYENDRSKRGVVYRSVKDGSTWIREEKEFLSDVDAEKYPEFAGQKRMTKIGTVIGSCY